MFQTPLAIKIIPLTSTEKNVLITACMHKTYVYNYKFMWKKIGCIFSISHFIIFGAVKYIEKGSMKIFSWHCEIKLITVKFSGFSGLICSKFLSIHLRSFSSLLCNDDKTTYLTFKANFLLIWYQLYPNIYLPPRRIELWEIIFLIEV